MECNPLTDEGYRYFWQVRACDSYNCSNYTSLWNFSIVDYLDFELTTNTINFTQFGLLQSNDVVDTLGGSPGSFIAENKGNVAINITNVTASALWSTASLDTDYYQFMAGNSSEPDSFNWSGSMTFWNNVTATANTNVLISNLGYRDVADTAAIHVRLVVPPAEPSGEKTSTINFHIQMAD